MAAQERARLSAACRLYSVDEGGICRWLSPSAYVEPAEAPIEKSSTRNGVKVWGLRLQRFYVVGPQRNHKPYVKTSD